MADRSAPSTFTGGAGGIAAVAVIAIVVSMVFVMGSSDSGYSENAAASPEAAAGSLLTALATRNPLEAANTLPPEEGDALYPLVKAALAKIKDAGLVDSTDPESAFSGVDFDTGNVRFSASPIRDDLAKVSVDSLTVRMSVDAAEAQQGVREDFLTGEDATYTNTDTVRITPDDGVFVMAVKGDSGWSISALYTLLAYAADDAGYSADSGPVTVPQSRGADSPQDAVDATIAAGLDLLNGRTSDVSAVAATLSPYEARAVMTYRTFLESELGSATGLRRNDITASVDSASSQDIGGGLARVRLNEASVSIYAASDDYVRANNDGTCMQVAFPDESDDFCLHGIVSGDSPYVIAQHDDGWHVSILGTAMDLGADVLGKVSIDELARIYGGPLVPLSTPGATVGRGESTQIAVNSEGMEQFGEVVKADNAGVAILALDHSKGNPYSVDVISNSGESNYCRVSLYEGVKKLDSDYWIKTNISGDSKSRISLQGDGARQGRLLFGCDRAETLTVTYN